MEKAKSEKVKLGIFPQSYSPAEINLPGYGSPALLYYCNVSTQDSSTGSQ
ncbi:hypothetical protein Hsw_4169 [Hymenobacter swuensis DY53]|uniref:Uncharacterized protein n=1 Tax=Hymenobacter swuensis DY53 TaxID=1227739 RepID=W8F2Y4_9BACT|nr:hypothetical protein Hsw_4169 [Hymenobacter swuensis DY53]